jgi:hypothetical protein
VASLVTAVVLNLRVNGMSKDLEENWNTPKNSTRQNYTTTAWIAYGVGATCAVGGAALYYLGWHRGQRSASIAFVPVVGPDMAGAIVERAY